MSKEAYSRLKEIVYSQSSQGISNRVQLDEIAHLTEICGSALPTKFIQLVKEADKVAGGHSDGAWRLFRNRLVAILEVNSSFPTRQKTEDSVEVELLPTFSLSKSDKDRVIKLCDQMRKIIHASEAFDVPHKRRLLNRIAAIEKQVYSDKGLFDVVLGGVSDIGETLGKFGGDIKPLTDRMSEIKKITRSGSKEYKQLPELEEVKSLPAPEEDEG